jgi:hypothetical protein
MIYGWDGLVARGLLTRVCGGRTRPVVLRAGLRCAGAGADQAEATGRLGHVRVRRSPEGDKCVARCGGVPVTSAVPGEETFWRGPAVDVPLHRNVGALMRMTD